MSVCDNQQKFNNAFYEALKTTKKTDEKKMASALALYSIIHAFFIVFAIILAFESQPPDNRVVHITLAIVFGPAYIIAFFINKAF